MKDTHLYNTNRELMLPEDMIEFSNMEIFQPQEDITTKNLKIEGEPLVIDCDVTPDEKKVLLLLPKFATMEKISMSQHKFEIEKMKAKARYELRD